jgi:hypothetical protein
MDLTEEMIADLEIELFRGPSPYGLFRLCRVYVDKYYQVGEVNETPFDVLHNFRFR